MTLRRFLSKSIPYPIKRKLDRSAILSFLGQHSAARAVYPHIDSFLLCGLSNKIEKKILGEDYDRINTALIRNLVHEGHVCLDIGANIGSYSVALAELCGPRGTVHSFEPVNHIRQKLHLNLAVNGARNVTVNDFALGDQDAELEMHQVKEGVFRAGTSSFVKNPTIQGMGDDKFVVELAHIKTLDGYLATTEIPKVDFIKIDVEGFELNVLRGGAESIKRFRPAIILEFDYDRHGENSYEFANFFALLDYVIFQCRSVGGNVVVEPFDFSFQPKERNLLCLPLGK